MQALLFAAVAGARAARAGQRTNLLTAWLTTATFLGYAVVYTIFLKPRTPQNNVGALRARCPGSRLDRVTGEISSDALLLFLIVFAWTAAAFLALALYRRNDYARAGVPMLPITHWRAVHAPAILLYPILLSAISLLPFASGLSSWIYLTSASRGLRVFLSTRSSSTSTTATGWAAHLPLLDRHLSCLFAALLIDTI